MRGVAILGILLLNIVAFGLPDAAYLNPAWAGFVSSRDAWTWALMDLFAQAKFLTLLSLLFGAGLQLLLARGKQWLQARLKILIVIGLLHAVFFWEGDILLTYGLVGLICWRIIARIPETDKLFRTGVVLYAMGVGVLLLLGLLPAESANDSWLPSLASLQHEQAWKLNGGFDAINNRASQLTGNLLAVAVQYGWQMAGMMLVGAALMRSGWLRGDYSEHHYRRLAVILIFTGLAVNLPGIYSQWLLRWDARWCALLLQAPRELSAPFQAIGYAALILGYWSQISRSYISHAIVCVGRMAISNYLLQTVLCTTLFYHVNLFMHFDRLSLLMLVPMVWLVNLLFSIIWLSYFRLGPVEWLWRQLTDHLAGRSSGSNS